MPLRLMQSQPHPGSTDHRDRPLCWWTCCCIIYSREIVFIPAPGSKSKPPGRHLPKSKSGLSSHPSKPSALDAFGLWSSLPPGPNNTLWFLSPGEKFRNQIIPCAPAHPGRIGVILTPQELYTKYHLLLSQHHSCPLSLTPASQQSEDEGGDDTF